MQVPSESTVWECIVMQLPDAVVCSDTAGIVTHWNAAAEKLFGYSASEAVGQSLDLIIPEKLRALHWQGFQRAMDAGVTAHDGPARVTKAITKAGDAIYVETTFGVLKNTQGQVIGASSVSRDVTDRYRKPQQ